MIWIWPVGEFVALFGGIGAMLIGYFGARHRALIGLRAPAFISLLYATLPVLVLSLILLKQRGDTTIIMADYLGKMVVEMLIASPFALWGRSKGRALAERTKGQ